MDELIARAGAIDALTNTNLKRNTDSVRDGDINRTRRAAQRVIAQLPTVDAIPVVRCRDCKYYYGVNEECGCNGGYHSEDWYCADGEKRNDDEAD